ncbi:MAG: FG-GAP repeat protein [Ferruginibacter sp.]
MKKSFAPICFLCLISIINLPKSLFSQNVGIGTASPNEKLHVAGNIKADTLKPNAIKFTTNAGTGKILTSDAAGNASWQNNTTTSATGNTGYGVWGDCNSNGNITDYIPIVDATGSIADNFGYSTSISGSYAIVGAYLDDVGNNPNQGSASIYQYNGSTWTLMQKLTDAAGGFEDRFGNSVSISGSYAIIGSYLDDIGTNTDQGSVSFYHYNGASWVLTQKLTDATGAALDRFGTSVSISGNYAIVGANLDDVGANTDQGSVSIYQYNGATWVLMQKITDATGEADAYFGTSVSISGNYAVVGAYGDDEVITDQGSASIYQYNGAAWVFMQKKTGFGVSNYGYSVSISGSYVIVGAFKATVGPYSSQGLASMYHYDGANWVWLQDLTDPNGAASDNFGVSVSISGDYAMVGAYSDDVFRSPPTAFNFGSASIYQRLGNAWQRIQYLVDPAGLTDDFFGFSTAIDGNTKRFAAGALNYGSSSGKVVFGKIN